MSLNPAKNVFLAYCDEDRRTASALRETLQSLIGEDVWMRDFDLDGGSLVVEELTDAAAEAKWFVILISSASVHCQWLKTEASLATFRAIEDLSARIIVVHVENFRLPQTLKFAVDKCVSFDLYRAPDPDEEYFKIAEYIQQNTPEMKNSEVYVNRGDKTDEFALVARRNTIVFVLGWPGIGKTAFVLRSVSASLGKRALVLKLTVGHSLDLLARQILQKCHAPQPPGDFSDQELLSLAMEALKNRASRFFVLLDNAERGLNADNTLLPYLQQFLGAFCESETKTHVLLTTTRIPDYPPSIAFVTDVLNIGGLAKRYIKETIDLLLTGHEKHDQLMEMPLLDDLVTQSQGHPLAAKMLASFMKVRPLESLVSVAEKTRFELRLAQYILQSAGHAILTPLHNLILQILATVRDPLLMEDVLASSDLQSYSQDDIQKARLDLANWFFVEQEGELIYLHNFLASFYANELTEVPDRRDRIARDVGTQLFKKALAASADLNKTLFEEFNAADNEETQRISNEVFRYAVPAAKLLRSVGEDKMADELPIQVKGTLREMVFFFYQEKRDWNKTLHFAEKWLELSPDDIEIQLQRIRCYRNFRTKEYADKAEELLAQLSVPDYGKYFSSRLFREKALLSRDRGDVLAAKDYFKAGINLNTLYPENYVGLAELLLKEAENLSLYDFERTKLARDAVALLRKARSTESARFDLIHLGLYLEALLEAGYDDTALPLLKEALEERPRDARLNYHMAEIMRAKESYDDAEQFATTADKYGYQKAPLSLANIMFDQSQRLSAQGDEKAAEEKLKAALRVLERFRAQFGTDEMVANTIKAKVYRGLGRLAEARDAIQPYMDTSNTYTISEFCKVDIAEAIQQANDGRTTEALSVLNRAAQRIKTFSLQHRAPSVLRDLLKDIEQLKKQLKHDS